MKAHVIKSGRVANTIEVRSLSDFPNLVDAALGGSIGWFYDGQTFTPPPATVPDTITLRQLKLALIELDKLDAVEAAIAALPLAQRRRMKVEWETSQVVERSKAWVTQLAAVAGVTTAALFTLAESL